MSGGRLLLLFLDDGVAPPMGWLRLTDGQVVARGAGTSGLLPAEAEAEERVIAVVPGTDVTIHQVDLPELAPPQAQAAGRLLAAEVSAEPVERLHVAVGDPTGEGARAMAVVSAARMRAWLGQAQALGFDPETMVAEPFLLPEGEDVLRWDRGDIHVLRGPGIALAAEPAIAAASVGAPAMPIDGAAAEAGFAGALAALPVDLRQGPFARRRRWAIDWGLMRRLALLGVAILGVTLLIQFVLMFRYDLAADAVERETELVAGKALPRAGRIADAPTQLRERLAELRGGGLGYSTMAAGLFAAVRDSANVELSALQFDRDGSLRVTAAAPSPSDLIALTQRLQAQGFVVEAGEARSGGGRQIADITVRAQ